MANKSFKRPVWLDLDYRDGGGNLYTTTPHYILTEYTRVASDTPSHRALEYRGGNATNANTTIISEASFKRGGHTLLNINRDDSWKGRTTTVRRFATVYAMDSTAPSAALVSSVNNKALIGIIKKIREHQQSDFSGPTFLGELRETVSMIKSPFATIRQKLGILTTLKQRIHNDRVKRGRYVAKNWANVISSTWLEFAFGVMPAVNDISSIMKLLSDKLSKQSGLARLSYRYADDEVSQFNATHSYTGESGGNSLTTRRVIRHSRQYIVGIRRAFPSSQGLLIPCQNLLDYGRFDLAEVLPTAWELIPFSWLIDYVTNIGDLLGCTFDYNEDLAWVCISDLSTTNCKRWTWGHYTDPLLRKSIAVEPEELSTSYKRYVRSSVGQLGVPHLEFSLPNVGQANNTLQLLIQLASSSPSKMR